MEYYRSIFSIVDKIKQNGLVIYGAGFWCDITISIFQKFLITPICICEEAEDGSSLPDCQQYKGRYSLCTLNEAALNYPDAVYIVAETLNDKRFYAMRDKLNQKGLLSEYSGFHASRYMFILEGGLDAADNPSEITEQHFRAHELRNLLVLNPNGPSGVTLISNLVDLHPNVLGLLTLNIQFRLKLLYENRLRYLKGKELAIEITAQMQFYFWHSYLKEFDEFFTSMYNHYYSNEDGSKNKQFCVNSNIFIQYLAGELESMGYISFAEMIKVIHTAYYNVMGVPYSSRQKYWIALDYHSSGMDATTISAYFEKSDFDRMEFWYTIREPVRGFFSLLSLYHHKNSQIPARFTYSPLYRVINKLLKISLLTHMEINETNKNSIVRIIRFEDLKCNMQGMMSRIANILDIPYHSAMDIATINGVPAYYNPPHNLHQHPLATNDQSSIKLNDYSDLLSSFDIFRLNLVYYWIKDQLGYQNDVPSSKNFSKEFLRELFQIPFKFEMIAIQHLPEEEYREVYSHDSIAECILTYLDREPPQLFANILMPNEEDS